MTAVAYDHLLGTWTPPRTAPYPVSLESIRRFVQGAMLPDDVYGNDDPAMVERHGGIVAPPLYPLSVFVRPLRTPDPLDRFATDPDWDAAGGMDVFALPPLETPFAKSLNGGTEARPVRLARVGDVISCQARYLDITPRQGRTGPMLVVRIEARYTDQDGQDLLRTVRTIIRR
ncbi:MaoC family dehydratase N-terminal domain-containing protein [Dactylosporangium sp. AC04546]|uniref:FAS1-like dehydratase domain-containing protein n=1 Tax=Dactylosporangium sp. AC04546 TaxID=2862460 RepID=UPI001EDFD5C4|nr:MaoC family dehydratase N-terminal domain-containing protein [Dactylosporangium sp. AC04546]WVK79528.1 MaoC family dehydratase N-terminal domain-containing protein [Dactylosporangium sp. AC04546]